MKPADDSGLPWPRLMEIAFGILGIAPEVFWNMTPPEWLAAFTGWKRKYGIAEDTPAITRKELEELQRRFPDVTAPEDYWKAF